MHFITITPPVVLALKLLLRFLLVAAVAFTAIVFLSPPSLAFADDAAPLVAEDVDSLVISQPVWSILVGAFLPLVVGVIINVTRTSSEKVRAVIGIVVAAVGALVTRATLVDGSAVFTQALVIDVFLVYVPQLATYLGVWQKFQINRKIMPSNSIS